MNTDIKTKTFVAFPI